MEKEPNKKKFMNLIKNLVNESKEKNIKNSDTSCLNNENILEQLKVISICETNLDLLLTLTEKVNGCGSFYPEKCLNTLKTFRTILEMELK